MGRREMVSCELLPIALRLRVFVILGNPKLESPMTLCYQTHAAGTSKRNCNLNRHRDNFTYLLSFDHFTHYQNI